MSDEKIVADLAALASGSQNRTKTGRLRAMFEEIEITMAAGVSRETIVATLKANGLEMTVPVFDNAMSRIRHDRKNKTSKPGLQGVSVQDAKQTTSAAISEREPQPEITPSSENNNLGIGGNPQALINVINQPQDVEKLARLAQQARKAKR